MGEGMEVNASTSESRGKEQRIGLSYVPDGMQAQLVKACLGLWAGTHSLDTGKGASQALASSGGTTVRPSGFWQALATLATYLVADRPTHAVSATSGLANCSFQSTASYI